MLFFKIFYSFDQAESLAMMIFYWARFSRVNRDDGDTCFSRPFLLSAPGCPSWACGLWAWEAGSSLLESKDLPEAGSEKADLQTNPLFHGEAPGEDTKLLRHTMKEEDRTSKK